VEISGQFCLEPYGVAFQGAALAVLWGLPFSPKSGSWMAFVEEHCGRFR